MMRRHLLRISSAALIATLSPALHAQAPAAAPPAPPADSPPAAAPPAASPSAPPAAPVAAPAPAAAPPVADVLSAPAPDSANPSVTAASAGDASKKPPARRSSLAAARRRTARDAPADGAAGEEPSSSSNDPSIDRPATPPAPAAPIPRVSVWLGFGNLWVPSDGLDPFSEDDALATFNAGAGLSLAQAGALDIAAVVGVDITGSDEHYRGEDTSLGLLRLALGPELRSSLFDRLYWHGRLAPTLTRLSVELDEQSSGATLADAHWLWGAEAALGLDLRFAEASTSLPYAVGFFARVDAGYGWTSSAALELAADSGAPVRTQPLELGELALSGPFFRANIGVGY